MPDEEWWDLAAEVLGLLDDMAQRPVNFAYAPGRDITVIDPNPQYL